LNEIWRSLTRTRAVMWVCSPCHRLDTTLTLILREHGRSS